MQHKIEIPEGCKAIISKENGCLVIEIEKNRWKPQNSETYYTPFVSYGNCIWVGGIGDTYRYEMNAVFKTKAESDAAAEQIKQLFAK